MKNKKCPWLSLLQMYSSQALFLRAVHDRRWQDARLLAPIVDIHDHEELAFRTAVVSNNLAEARWYLAMAATTDRPINVHILRDAAFRSACLLGHLQAAQWMHSTFPGIVVSPDVFPQACEAGHLQVAKWMLSVGTQNYPRAFLHACAGGQLAVAQWLVVTYDAQEPLDFRWAFKNGTLEVAQWLLETWHPDAATIKHTLVQACRGGELARAQWLQSLLAAQEPLHVLANMQAPCTVYLSCPMRHLGMMQWLIEDQKEPWTDQEWRHAWNCASLDVLRWLFQRFKQHHEAAFTLFCRLGDVAAAQYVQALVPISDQVRKDAFVATCANGHVQAARWLLTSAQCCPSSFPCAKALQAATLRRKRHLCLWMLTWMPLVTVAPHCLQMTLKLLRSWTPERHLWIQAVVTGAKI